ncbi:Enoyl-CoA hydratase [Pseudonocardia thermophila]|uniref:Enoyl-CoA hydratase n=1 Tax=Pseudonocardia thermophila TaxID=1848 RepID=A0A1M6UY84_PSETH|nr:enoyl-CoA hydratase-related protein [Pseudonocardia thermophila]SHK74178.1 Enoyl-CoA hydratase [Pseudonocardia thermophila]
MSDSPDDVVLYEVADGVAILTFNRPERNNAWNLDLEFRYFDLLDAAEADPAVRVVVVTATGRCFCPGADFQRLDAKANGAPPPERRRPISYPFHIRKPMIAAINGPAAGLGLVQAALCDVRFAAVGTRMTTAFTRRGLIAEHLISWLLPRLVGHGVASDLLLSGRMFTAEEACAMGLVNRVVPAEDLLAETLAYAKDMAANCSPLAMAQVKQQLRADWLRSPEAALASFEELNLDPRRRAELREGVASFRERRPPRFPPLADVHQIGI